jgi:hypothetical protein
MFAHAMSSTRPTTAISAFNGRSYRLRSVDRPAAAGSSTNGSLRNRDWRFLKRSGIAAVRI